MADKVNSILRRYLVQYLGPYWGFADQYIGRLPPREQDLIKPIWNKYKAFRSARRRQLLAGLSKEEVDLLGQVLAFEKETQAAARIQFPKLDAALIRWGYGGRPRTELGMGC